MDQAVTLPEATDSIRADVSGEISGQVAVGKYILQIGSVHGGAVHINMPDQRPRLRARPAPVYVLPRQFSGLLDRIDEVAAAAKAVPAAQPVEFHAKSGTGKTTLLRVLAHHSLTTAFGDGVIYLSARDKTPADLLQSIFEALFEYEALYKPGEGEIRHALQRKRALILLDDVELSREEVESLFDAAPQCAFLLASSGRKIWSEGLSIHLPGLPARDARRLLERELGRELSEDEDAPAEEILAAVEESPLAIIQLAALVREQGFSLKSLAALERDEEPDQKIAALSLGLLTDPERRVVASIAALDGAPLNARHLPALTGIVPTESLLDRLQKRGLIQQNETGFTLAGSFALFVRKSWDLTKWREGMLNYFSRWASARINDPYRIVEDADAILNLIDWAKESGRWEGALALVKKVEGALSLRLRWGAWEQSLQHGLEAAQGQGNLSEKAWVLHQLGTRALCLGDKTAARQALIQALRLREMLGDEAGAAATRQNLDLLLNPPGGNNGASSPDQPSSPAVSLYNLAAGTLSVLVASGVVLSSALLALVLFFSNASNAPLPTPSILPPSTLVWTEENPIVTSESSTATPSASPTHTVVPSADTPTSTATSTQTQQPPPTLTHCTPRQEWPVYFIQPGDTLWSIAQVTGSSVPDLRIANCLPDSRIYTGQPLFVPNVPVATNTPTPSRTATVTETPTETPSPTTPAPQFPDLVASLDTGTTEPLDSAGESTYVGIPLTLTFSNQGQDPAGPFQAVVYARGVEPEAGENPNGLFIEPLVIQIDDPLEPGSSLSISTRLVFPAPNSWREIEVWVAADDCRDLQLEEYCQVKESDEQNNQSPVKVVVLPVNLPPTVKITNLEEQETILWTQLDGERWSAEIVLEGYAEDPEDGLLDGESMVWTTDRTDLQDEYLNTGRAVTVRLYSDQCKATNHTVTLSAIDSQGATGSHSHPITLLAGDCTPTLKLEIPFQETYTPAGYEKDPDRHLLILGVGAWAYDALGRPIGGDRIQWTTDRTDIQDQFLGYGENLELLLYLPDDPYRCDEVTHTVRVTATDLEGNQAEESVPIRIEEQDCY